MSHFDDQPTFEPGATPSPTPPSTTFPYPIDARYRCIELIGHGSSGAVYRAFDTQLQRDVAIKFIHHQQLNERRRLIAEGRVLAQLDHPNICKVYEVAEEGDAVYLVMSFINGSHLSSWQAHFTPAQHVELVAQVCAALQAAHRNGIVHCDVKPANIVLREDARDHMSAVLVDFGVAHSDTHTSYQSGAGTRQYMAPERFTDAAATLTPASDIYSIGATLGYLFTGRHDAQSLSQLPTDLRLIVEKALKPDPRHRYASVQQLHDDLRAWQHSRPISLRRSPAYRLQRLWQRSTWLRFTSIATTVLAVALVIGATTYQNTLRQRQIEEVNIREDVALTVNEIDSIYRSPAHDRKDALDELHSDANAWFAEAAEQPDWLAAANYSAAGRIFVELDEYDKAFQSLTQAWELGEQSQRTAMALAQVYVRFYLIADSQARNLTSADAREAALAEARVEYQQPGLDYLDQADASELPRDYVRAMRAYLNNEPERALQLLWNGRYPVWFYPRFDFIMRIQSNRLFNRLLGRTEGDYQPVLRDLEDAQAKLAALTPSSFSPHFLMALVYNEISAQRSGDSAEKTRLESRLAQHIDAMRELDPSHPHTYHFSALQEANRLARAGESAEVTLARANRAVRYSEQALAEARRREWPPQQQVRLLMSALDRINLLVQTLQNQSLTAERALLRYFVLAEDVPQAHHGARFNMNLANAHQAMAIETGQGPGAEAHWQQADEAYVKAREIAPGVLGFHANHANMLNQWAERTNAEVAEELLSRALEAIQMVSAKAPNHAAVLYIQGRVSLNAALAQTMLTNPARAEALFEQAEQSFHRALAQSDNMDFARQQLADLRYLYDPLRESPRPRSDALDQAEEMLDPTTRPIDGSMLGRLLAIDYQRWRLSDDGAVLDSIRDYTTSVLQLKGKSAHADARRVLYSIGITQAESVQSEWFTRASAFEPVPFSVPVDAPSTMTEAVLQTYAAYQLSREQPEAAGYASDLQTLCEQSLAYETAFAFHYSTYLSLRETWQLLDQHSQFSCPGFGEAY